MVKLPSAKVYSKSVSDSYPGQSPKCVKVTTLGSRTLHIHVNVCDVVLVLGVLQCNGTKLEEDEDFKCVFVRMENGSAPVRELLSNNSLFVGQLYEDKSLALPARDLIFFTTDLKTVNY